MDIIICKDCGKEFRKFAKLQRHTRETHQNIKPFKCEVCHKEFKRNSHLKRHEISHSENPKPLPCTMEDCPQRFSNKYHLARHIKIVHDQDRYRCRFCELSFKKKRFFQKHMTETHSSLYNQETIDSIISPVYSEQPFICSDAFQKRVKIDNDQYQVVPNTDRELDFLELIDLEVEDLLDTLKDVDPPKPKRELRAGQNRELFKCCYNSCCKSFPNLAKLKLHLRSFHIKMKPYKCDQFGCKANFRRKSSLERHHSVKHAKISESAKPSNVPFLLTTANDYFDISRPSFTDFLNLEDACNDFLQDSALRYNFSIRRDELDNL